MFIKCIVKGCSNRTSEGGFVGDLCSPCYHILSTGNTQPSHAWFVQEIGHLRHTLSEAKRLLDKST